MKYRIGLNILLAKMLTLKQFIMLATKTKSHKDEIKNDFHDN